jgi:hypothetical protein
MGVDTTRSPRPGEVNGTAYHFTTRDSFLDMVSQDAFIEHAEFSGNMYGTSAKAVEEVAKKGGKRCILDIDTQVRPSLPLSFPCTVLTGERAGSQAHQVEPPLFEPSLHLHLPSFSLLPPNASDRSRNRDSLVPLCASHSRHRRSRLRQDRSLRSRSCE